MGSHSHSHSHHSHHHHQLKKGPWTSSEDAILVEYVKKHGEGNWNAVQKHSGLYRCGKSCRLRWANHLRPNLKKGAFTADEERLILELHSKIGNKWARMASQLPGRTDNEIKNYWNTRIKRRQRAGLPLYPPDIQQQFSVSNHQSQTTQIHSSPEHFNVNAEGAFCLNSNSDNSVVTFDNPDLPTALPSFFGYGEPSMLQQPYGEIHHHLKGLRNNSFLKVPLLSTSYPMTSSFGSQVFYPTGIGEMPLSNQQLINGNVTFSASKSYSGFVKMELPSIQLAGSEQPRGPEHSLLNNVGSDALLSSIPLSSQMLANVDSSFEPNANNGLLETLLHEAQAMVVAKIPSMSSPAQSSSDFQGASSCSSSNTTDNVLSIQSKANECRSSDPMSSLEGHAFSMFREASATMGTGLLEKSTSTQSAIGKKIKSEDPSEEPISSNSYEDESFPAITSYEKLDILSEAEWFNQNSGIVKGNTIIGGSLSPLSNDDMGVGIQHMPSIAILSNQAWELSSCPWSNMPGVC